MQLSPETAPDRFNFSRALAGCSLLHTFVWGFRNILLVFLTFSAKAALKLPIPATIEASQESIGNSQRLCDSDMSYQNPSTKNKEVVKEKLDLNEVRAKAQMQSIQWLSFLT